MKLKKGDIVRRKSQYHDNWWKGICAKHDYKSDHPLKVSHVYKNGDINLHTIEEPGLISEYFELVAIGDKDDPLNSQVGGTHYKEKGIQPIEYINANALNFNRGNIIKYGTGRDSKHGTEEEDIVKGLVQDLEKVKHYADFEIKRLKKYGR